MRPHAISPILSVLFFACAAIPLQAQKQCGHTAAVSVNNGAYKIGSNAFESDARECISIDNADFTVTESDIPWKNRPSAYPFIYIGCHWGSCTANSGLPVQVSKIENASSDWNTTQPTSGAYDAAYDIWFHTAPSTSGRPEGAELMIWLNSRGGIQPAGSVVANKVSLGGATYGVWFKRIKGRSYIAYVAANTTLSVSNFDVLAFIQDAVRRGYINPSWYLISIEAGFELWQGGAGLATNSFAATVNNRLGAAPMNLRSPADGEVVSGERLFRARLENIQSDSYQLFWSVDGGGPNPMHDSHDGGEHKEAVVDFASWNWRDAGIYYGPFSVTFIAEDLTSVIVHQKTIAIYVAK